jgi:hypothetical protein
VTIHASQVRADHQGYADLTALAGTRPPGAEGTTTEHAMSRTPTRRPGRLRALAVVGALAISMIAGAAAPAFADDDSRAFPGSDTAKTVLGNLFVEDGGVSPQGWSWF